MRSLQTVLRFDFDPRNKDMVKEMCDGANLVVNLLGIHQETWNFSFPEVHVDFARTVAEAAAATPSVERMLHVSCLGASPRGPSERLRTKVGSRPPPL